MLKDRTRLFHLLPVLLLSGALVACQTTQITPPAQRCSSMIPEAWAAGIEAVPLPGFETVGEVLTAFIDQSARLQMANDRLRDTVTIYGRCETLVNESQKRRGLF